jgi:hypothetical protein
LTATDEPLQIKGARTELTSIVVYGQHRDDRFQAASFC